MFLLLQQWYISFLEVVVQSAAFATTFFPFMHIGSNQHRVQQNIVAVHKISVLCKYQQQQYLQFICVPPIKVKDTKYYKHHRLEFIKLPFGIGHLPLQVGLFDNVNGKLGFIRTFFFLSYSISLLCIMLGMHNFVPNIEFIMELLILFISFQEFYFYFLLSLIGFWSLGFKMFLRLYFLKS